MKIKGVFIIVCLVMTSWFLLAQSSIGKDSLNAEFQPLEWIDLIPESERDSIWTSPIVVEDHTGEIAKQNQFGDTRQELDSQMIVLSGFMIPLVGNEQSTTEFLLVPYVGACIHVPPPPENQIVYVTLNEGIRVHRLFQPITVYGELSVDSISSEMAQAGYHLVALQTEESSLVSNY